MKERDIFFSQRIESLENKTKGNPLGLLCTSLTRFIHEPQIQLTEPEVVFTESLQGEILDQIYNLDSAFQQFLIGGKVYDKNVLPLFYRYVNDHNILAPISLKRLHNCDDDDVYMRDEYVASLLEHLGFPVSSTKPYFRDSESHYMNPNKGQRFSHFGNIISINSSDEYGESSYTVENRQGKIQELFLKSETLGKGINAKIQIMSTESHEEGIFDATVGFMDLPSAYVCAQDVFSSALNARSVLQLYENV